MIYLYTENLIWKNRIKTFVKTILGMQQRGPQAVVTSLVRGLEALHIPYVINIIPDHPIDVACVLTGSGALRKIITLKKKKIVQKIIAGPIISIIPQDHDGILFSSDVTACVVPCAWSKNWWTSLAPQLGDKIKLWPAGVEESSDSRSADAKQVIIYYKHAPVKLYAGVIKILKQQSIPYTVLRYGHFSRNHYTEQLLKSRYVIYLTQSESQGLALQEAWMRDVPTLVWNCGYMEYNHLRWQDSKISAPLLTDQCGLFFHSLDDFPVTLDSFTRQLENFSPRQYAAEYLTDVVCAKKYLEIIANV